MKLLFKIYGTSIIAVSIVVSLFLILTNVKDPNGNVGIINILGGIMNIPTSSFDSYSDTGKLSQIMLSEKPTASYSAASLGPLYAGDGIHLKPYFSVKTSQSEEVYSAAATSTKFKFYINSIKDGDGNDLYSLYNIENDTFVFPSPGTYLIGVTVIDAENQYSRLHYLLPVDTR